MNELGAGDEEDGGGDSFCDGGDDVQGLGEDGDGGVDGEEGDDVGVGSPDVNSGSKSKRRCCHDVNILPNATSVWVVKYLYRWKQRSIANLKSA